MQKSFENLLHLHKNDAWLGLALKTWRPWHMAKGLRARPKEKSHLELIFFLYLQLQQHDAHRRACGVNAAEAQPRFGYFQSTAN